MVYRTWTTFPSRSLIRHTSIALVFTLLTPIAGAESLKFAEDAMCIPAGDELWTKHGIKGDVNSYLNTEEIKIGPATIPKGCQITFGSSSELTSLSDLKEIAEKRIVTVISNCQFKMAEATLVYAEFDLEGCLDGYQQVIAPKNICGKKTNSFELSQYYFDGGFLRCDHKDENN